MRSQQDGNILDFKATSLFRNATYRMTSFFKQGGFTHAAVLMDESELG
jgi:hypothetical protein